MIIFLIGLILFCVPFVLVNLFEDKKRGFVYVLFFLLFFHVALAFLTQAAGVFYYGVVISISFAVDLLLLITYFYLTNRRFKISLMGFGWIKNISLSSIKSFGIALSVVVISLMSLFQVHYNYNGQISLSQDISSYHYVQHEKYVYPYFSDEWYAVSFIDSSLVSHTLPLKNMLRPDHSFFLNLEMFTHSFLAEVMLIFGLNPLTQYTLVSVVVNALIIVLAYVLLRANNVSGFASAIASLSLLYITASADMPGIWHLLPITLGIVFSFIGFFFISLDDTKMVFLSLFLASLFYPLLFPFYGLAMLIFLYAKFKTTKKNMFRMISYCAIAIGVIIPFFLLLLMLSPWSGFISYISSKLFYPSFSGDFTPQLNIFYIIPWPIILLATLGLPFVFKNKTWLFFQLVAGTGYWIFYFFTTQRIIIEFERVVFFTSIITVLIAGFGLDRLTKYLDAKYKNVGRNFLTYAQVLVLVLFLGLVPFYTRGDNWEKLVMVNHIDGTVLLPRAPANNYLTQDDIRIFKNIKYSKFLSIPWKGTVIGVATDNYPTIVKGGTIAFGPQDLPNLFMSSDCKTKKDIVQKRNIDYVYLYGFNCSGFKKVDQSQEGFVLYKVSEN